MATGTVTVLSDRGFGFIRPHQGGEPVLFHHWALVGVTIGQLRRGERVTYSTEQDPNRRRLRAVGVRRAE